MRCLRCHKTVKTTNLGLRRKYTWADGDAYEGEWKDGKRHGQGIYTHKSGKREKRVYENSKQISSKVI